MKTLFTSNEIAHSWAHKSATHGRCPANMHFSGGAFYSYNTVIARHIEHKGKPAVLLNDTHYSPSTSNHFAGVRSSVFGLDIPIFYVDSQKYGAELRLTGEEIFSHYVQRAADCMEASKTPRIRATTIEGHKARAAHFLGEAKRTSDFFGLRRKVDEKAIARLADAKAKAEKRDRIAREKRENAERQRQEENYKAWITSDGEQWSFNGSLFPIAFRVEGDELVSTLGARVPLRAAQIAYRFAMSRRGTAWHENGETCPVGHYRLNAINEHGIVAGCHRITWAELERLAPVLSTQEAVTA